MKTWGSKIFIINLLVFGKLGKEFKKKNFPT